ncbi:phosphocholine cytidylyltransferase family protein [Aeromonas diversa]|uniref:Nucleotidyl transferase n=1 Tax=Aeromonas diversa CDC 2478-85 TaxID=1268237 RepID=N9TXG5_9GAMM|nr:phosphocholine cytidylyltransferase family protein [Aeromonas diversa]ENY70809.1 nucleotidyl transferase [Aeromonas diversa CDC 2478-85]
MTKGLILAAGRGSRMGDLTSDRPKCLNMLRGKLLLDYQISAFRSAGISEIGIVSGYKHEMLNSFDLVEFHNDRWYETNMVSSLECAASWLDSDDVIVSYSDIFYHSDAITSLLDSDGIISITYDDRWLSQWSGRFVDPLSDAETFIIDKKGKLLEIGNKPHNLADIDGQYMGLLKFTPQAWRNVQVIRSMMAVEERSQMHMTATLDRLCKIIDIHCIPYEGIWGEIDSPSDIDYFERTLPSDAFTNWCFPNNRHG